MGSLLTTTSIHSPSEKEFSRKPARPDYAAPCMSIRSALQVVASPSDASIDLASLEGKPLLRVSARMPQS